MIQQRINLKTHSLIHTGEKTHNILAWKVADFLYCNDISVEQKSNGGKFAYCASVKFFTRVDSFVRLEIAGECCLIFTLVAMMCFLPSVFRNVISQRNKLTG